VLWFAWQAGRFGDAEWHVIKRSVQITVTPPRIEVRDPEKENPRAQDAARRGQPPRVKSVSFERRIDASIEPVRWPGHCHE
jgi:hypothetical protein